MKFSRFGFGSGLMSRDLAGRIDVDGVSRACVEMKNFELLQSGAVRTACCHAGVPLVGRDVGRGRGAGRGVDYFF